MSQYNPMSPKKIDVPLRGLINYLGLDSTLATHLKYHQPNGFEPEIANCHLNVLCQIKKAGGRAQHGWVLSQDKPKSFSVAIFHTVWRTPDDQFVDVTPRTDKEKRLLFVPDSHRTITLTRYEDRPAIDTFNNVCVVGSTIISPLTEITIELSGSFAQDQGLWPW